MPPIRPDLTIGRVFKIPAGGFKGYSRAITKLFREEKEVRDWKEYIAGEVFDFDSIERAIDTNVYVNPELAITIDLIDGLGKIMGMFVDSFWTR